MSIPRLSVVASHLVKTSIVRESDYSPTSALFISCEIPNAKTIFERCIARQMGHCMGGYFNIHIWAWSASPSVQVGRL